MAFLLIEYDELNLDGSGFESEDEAWDAIFEDLVIAEERSLGHDSWGRAYSEYEEDRAEVGFSKLANKYAVVKKSYPFDGEFIIVEAWLCDSKEEAMKIFNDYSVGFQTQEKEILKFKEAIGLQNIWLDAKDFGYGDSFCVNVKYKDKLLIEYLLSQNADQVRKQVERYEALRARLDEVGLSLVELYKAREQKGNQRCYVFSFVGADGEEYEYRRTLGSSLQNTGDRLVLDYLNEKWLNELIECERANGTKQKAEARQREALAMWDDVDVYDKKHPASCAPVSYEDIQPLFSYLESKIYPEKDTTHNFCDGSIRLTRAWLEAHMKDQMLPVLSYIRKNGGFCDCEVLFNAAEKNCWRK